MLGGLGTGNRLTSKVIINYQKIENFESNKPVTLSLCALSEKNYNPKNQAASGEKYLRNRTSLVI